MISYCLHCQKPFTPTRPHQRFDKPKCRIAFHRAGDGGTYAVVNRVTLLKRGELSLVIRVPPIFAENAFSLVKGRVLALVDVTEAGASAAQLSAPKDGETP